MIKELIVDSLNGFSLSYLPFFLLQILGAALLAHVFQIIVNKKAKESLLSNSALIASATALLVSIAKASINFSILGAAVLLLFMKFKEEDKWSVIGRVLIVGIGFGCGVGSLVQTIIGAVVLGLIILFMPLKK